MHLSDDKITFKRLMFSCMLYNYAQRKTWVADYVPSLACLLLYQGVAKHDALYGNPCKE